MTMTQLANGSRKCNEKDTLMESVDVRRARLETWLVEKVNVRSLSFQAILGDASFRRYFRIYTPEGSFIAMDAPPDQQNSASYISIGKALRMIGLKTPEVIAADLLEGFLLISDFGDLTYLKVLTAQNANELYINALTNLFQMQGCHHVPDYVVPQFTAKIMWQEWRDYQTWFVQRYLDASIENLDACFSILVESAVDQPQVFMHRDYHSNNLMLLPNNEMGILDFQDAFIGPVTYDLVSLLRDCYVQWPEDDIKAWVLYFWEKRFGRSGSINQEQFLRYFDLMGIERHLKALFTFARKAIRDHQPTYLRFVPRTLHYLQTVSARYPELVPLSNHIRRMTQLSEEKLLNCAS